MLLFSVPPPLPSQAADNETPEYSSEEDLGTFRSGGGPGGRHPSYLHSNSLSASFDTSSTSVSGTADEPPWQQQQQQATQRDRRPAMPPMPEVVHSFSGDGPSPPQAAAQATAQAQATAPAANVQDSGAGDSAGGRSGAWAVTGGWRR